MTVQPGPHRTRQRCSGPVCHRPSASRPVRSRQNRLQRRQAGADRAETARTGAVRTERNWRPSADRTAERRRRVVYTRSPPGHHPITTRSPPDHHPITARSPPDHRVVIPGGGTDRLVRPPLRRRVAGDSSQSVVMCSGRRRVRRRGDAPGAAVCFVTDPLYTSRNIGKSVERINSIRKTSGRLFPK